MEKLDAYLARERIARAAFAKAIGVSAPYLTQILTPGLGKCPSLSLAVKIEQATGGAVPVSSWVAAPSKGAA